MTSKDNRRSRPDTDEAASSGSDDPRSAGLSRVTVWISWLFMIGSVCFAVASIPLLAEVVPDAAIGTTYFVGSLFFTSASVTVAATTWRDLGSHLPGPARLRAQSSSLAWWAAIIQVAGTLWFNINTYDAMQTGLSTLEQNLRIWTPDFRGSTCFLVSSYLSFIVVCHKPWCVDRENIDWRIANLNLVGSVFFMLAALAAFVLPSTGDALDASLANSGTMLGALCFLWGARLLTRPAGSTVTAPG